MLPLLDFDLCWLLIVQRQSPLVGRVDGIECWEEADPKTFMVRGVNYMRYKRKVPSEDSMYR